MRRGAFHIVFFRTCKTFLCNKTNRQYGLGQVKATHLDRNISLYIALRSFDVSLYALSLQGLVKMGAWLQFVGHG